MAKDKEVKERDVSMAQALNAFVEHLHLSAEALEAIIDYAEPEDHRRSQDTIMEFGYLPSTNTSGNGDGEGEVFMYTEDSRILAEGDGPLQMEGTT